MGDGVRDGDFVGFDESAPLGFSAVGVESGRSSSHPRPTPTSEDGQGQQGREQPRTPLGRDLGLDGCVDGIRSRWS